jgi:hypothetical protein
VLLAVLITFPHTGGFALEANRKLLRGAPDGDQRIELE